MEESMATKRRARQAQLQEMDLKALREAAGKTQAEIARDSGMTQPLVSRAEGKGEHRISTLRRYVGALGGRLELVARFGERAVRLRGM
jgi:transcriptional regulator with XRE-family HTH domain